MSRRILIFCLTSLIYCEQTYLANKNLTSFHSKKQTCNCKNNVSCNDQGICPSGACAYPYVGIKCQHVSLALTLTARPDLPLELHDQDSTTCVGEFTFAGGTLLTKRIHLFWIYIIHREDKPVSLKLKAHDNIHILNNTIFTSRKISKNAMLFKLNIENKLITRLDFHNLSNVCLLKVGIGRNLALTGTAYQSTLSYDYGSSRSASEAIDGFVGTTMSLIGGRSCTQTKKGATVAWWRVRLIQNAKVNLVIITNRPIVWCRLRGFVLTTITEAGKEDIKYTAPDSIDKAKYSIVVAGDALIREVKVSINRYHTPIACQGRGILNLCEVQIFGEFVCPNGMVGTTCDVACPGCPKDGCDPDYGCLSGCSNGWKGPWCTEEPANRVRKCETFTFGPNCEHSCADNCANEGLCDDYTGRCNDGCKPGFYPPICRDACEPGRYDLNCSKICEQCSKNSTTGEHVCDPLTGQCQLGCSDGFRGDVFCEKIISFEAFTSNLKQFSFIIFLGFITIVLIARSCRRGSDDDVIIMQEVEGMPTEVEGMPEFESTQESWDSISEDEEGNISIAMQAMKSVGHFFSKDTEVKEFVSKRNANESETSSSTSDHSKQSSLADSFSSGNSR